MFSSVCKSFLHSRNGYCSVKLSSMEVVSLSLIRYFSSDAHNNPHSFTVSYLTQTCGLSPESALSVSKTVRFESSEQPDSVLSCFQQLGFSKTHISEMIKKYPKVLHCDRDKTISPKVDFFLSKGVSTPEIIKIFTDYPWILRLSLENALVRTFNALTELFQSEDKAMEVIKHNPRVSYTRLEAGLIPNSNTLREIGVPASSIFWLLRYHWLCNRTNPFKFEKIVEEVKEMGFDPLKLQFVKAIKVLTSVTKTKWNGRLEVYKRYGCSNKDVTKAFMKDPLCMAYSEDNIMGKMDFYVNKLSLDSSIVVKFPVLIGYSLKKRLIPRGAVIQYLSSKGIIRPDSSIPYMFRCSEMYFLENYVKCHEDAPHLIKLYNKKLNEASSEGKRSHEEIEIGES